VPNRIFLSRLRLPWSFYFSFFHSSPPHFPIGTAYCNLQFNLEVFSVNRMPDLFPFPNKTFALLFFWRYTKASEIGSSLPFDNLSFRLDFFFLFFRKTVHLRFPIAAGNALESGFQTKPCTSAERDKAVL